MSYTKTGNGNTVCIGMHGHDSVNYMKWQFCLTWDHRVWWASLRILDTEKSECHLVWPAETEMTHDCQLSSLNFN